MNVMKRYTLRSLKKNYTRTIVTIIGIVLSMSLLTAVIEGAYSGYRFLQRAEIDRAGSWMGTFYDLSTDEYNSLKNDGEIKTSAYFKEVGWANIDSENEDKPYLLIQSASDNISDLLKINVISGRMPQNSGEIILPTHLSENGKVRFSIDSTVSLAVGKRMSDGYNLNSFIPYTYDEEDLVDCEVKTYTVVGFYERLDYGIESYSCPGYTAITVGEASGNYHAFFTVKHPSKYYSFIENNEHSATSTNHTALINYYGTFNNSGIQSILYGFAAILVLLIAFGSISLIYNSFSISVSERTKEFGILSSIGATKKQIKKAVLFEALALSVIAIPLGMIIGCTGIGITLSLLSDSFARILDTGTTRMYIDINPVPLIISALCCLIITLISAFIPAKRAMKVSAIDAIRQTSDIKIKKRDVRTSFLTKKLFGFEGMMASKNFGRNKKRYRSTIISLFLSITLFVASSSFCAYLSDATNAFLGADSVPFDIYYTNNSPESTEELFGVLSSTGKTDKGTYFTMKYSKIHTDEDLLTKEFLNSPARNNGNDISVGLIFLCDDVFNKLCKDNGYDSKDFYNTDSPLALINNHCTEKYQPSYGPIKWYTCEYLSHFPAEIKIPVDTKEIEGYDYIGERTDIDGSSYVLYAKIEYDENGYKTHNTDEMLQYPLSEAKIYSTVSIAGEINTEEFWLVNSTSVIYPYSMYSSVINDEFKEDFIVFTAEDKSGAFDSMVSLLNMNGYDTDMLTNSASDQETIRMFNTVINVFSYGFIILISLIALANVFNTISTSILLRRREFAMLRSIGLSRKGFNKMMRFECLKYGSVSLLLGLPASVLVTYAIYLITSASIEMSFYIPWYSVAIAAASVFAVVFATMLYATHKIKGDNLIDELKTETM